MAGGGVAEVAAGAQGHGPAAGPCSRLMAPIAGVTMGPASHALQQQRGQARLKKLRRDRGENERRDADLSRCRSAVSARFQRTGHRRARRPGRLDHAGDRADRQRDAELWTATSRGPRGRTRRTCRRLVCTSARKKFYPGRGRAGSGPRPAMQRPSRRTVARDGTAQAGVTQTSRHFEHPGRRAGPARVREGNPGRAGAVPGDHAPRRG